MALHVDVKGPDALTAKRIANYLRACGLTHFVFRNDREPALRSTLFEAAKALSINCDLQNYQGEPVPVVAVPEESHPGESKSNGSAERAVQLVEDLVRTHKLALEHRIKMRIPMSHPVMSWLVEHVGSMLTKHHVHDEWIQHGGSASFWDARGEQTRISLVAPMAP